MTPACPELRAGLRSGAALALLVGLLAAHGVTARADGCALRHERRPVEAHFDHLTNAGALATHHDARPAPIPPCSGLKCRTGDPAPTPAPAPLPSSTLDHWAALTSADLTPRPAGARVDGHEASPRPIQAPLSLLRPPRG